MGLLTYFCYICPQAVDAECELLDEKEKVYELQQDLEKQVLS